MKLAVLGDPVEHSRSPAVHAAAYRTLGLDWQYEAVRQTPATVRGWLDGRDSTWLGCSVTAPLKETAASWAALPDTVVTLTGAANTVRFDTRAAWNTDVDGIVDAFAAADVAEIRDGAVLGGGATAVSAIVAFERMGARSVQVWMRSPEKGARLTALGERLGIAVQLIGPDAVVTAEAVVSTLPAHAEVVPQVDTVALLDADYARGVSRYAGIVPVVSGLEMLLHQALRQVRVFVTGDPVTSVDGEAAVWAAMRAAV